MKRTQLTREMAILLAIFGSTLATSAQATLFTDSTFNLSDYSADTHQTGGATINVSQTLLGGNPGAALEITTSAPAAGGSGFFSAEYVLNKSFLYDPGTQGPVKSVDFSLDVFLSATGITITAISAPSLIFQNGNYYLHLVPLPPTQGIFQTGSQSGLGATDFSLVTNLTTFATDPTQHPNFSNGILQFGILGAFVTSPGSPASIADVRADNLSISVNAVPEPQSYILLLVGLSVLGSMVRRNRS
jgi:PEP-CTERM motif